MKKKIKAQKATSRGKTSKTYFLEKASNLMYDLLIGQGDARNRLRQNELLVLYVLVLDVPNDFIKEQKNILKFVTKKGGLQVDDKIIVTAFQHTISNIRNSTASRIIQRLHSFYYNVKCSGTD